MSFGGRLNLPPFYREFEDVYRQLYEIYAICNYHGWGGSLPPVALVLNRSTRPTHVAGFAQMHATSVNGQVFNASDSNALSRPGPRLKDAALILFDFVNDLDAEEKPAA